MKLGKASAQLIATVFLVGVCLLVTARAQVAAANLGFDSTDGTAQPGMLVSTSPNAQVVDLADVRNQQSLLGVIDNQATSLNDQPARINVATDGRVKTLVSTMNGDIKVGDKIAPSVVKGIGAKAIKNGMVVGTAEASLDAKTDGAVRSQVSDSAGGTRTVYISAIPVVIHVYNDTTVASAASQTNTPLPVPTVLQKLADALAGKRASLLGLVLSFVVLLSGIVWTGLMINGTIRGSIMAISRQPLSRTSVIRTAMRAFVAAGFLLVVVVIAALVILRIL